jgi:hypothetical protein
MLLELFLKQLVVASGAARDSLSAAMPPLYASGQTTPLLKHPQARVSGF